MKPRSTSLAALSAQILAEVEAEERVKTAEVEAFRSATPRHQSDFGRLLHKMATDLRAPESDVTYDDLHAFAEGRL